MQRFKEIEPVLIAYPADCRPTSVEPLEHAGGFSGARLWRLTAPRGQLCLRRWPPAHPDKTRLRWIQRVVAHVAHNGFRLLPVAILTSSNDGFFEFEGHLWELTAWMPGKANYWADPRPEKLRAAMTALAQFHQAAATFPSRADDEWPAGAMALCSAPSPGIGERLGFVERLLEGRLAELRESTVRNRSAMPRLADGAMELFKLVTPCLHPLRQELAAASRLATPLGPCLRDIWHDHVLFDGDRVRGIVDLGSMRTESVAADVARLLGSLCGNVREGWVLGRNAYEAVRPLSASEHALVYAFDRSQVVLAGLKWVEWVFFENRRFSDPLAVVKRMEHILMRLRKATW